MVTRAAAVLLALIVAGATGSTLRDPPAATPWPPAYLDGGAWLWTLPGGASSGHGAASSPAGVPAAVPGDVLTDLERAAVIPGGLGTRWTKIGQQI